MNLTLYKKELRGSWKSLVLFGAILTMYIVMIVDMFDPELADALKQFEEMMPQLMSAVGMVGATDTLAGFMVTYLYGFLLLVVPMVYAILRGNALVARYVDSGSMAALLAAPVPRGRVVRTQLGALYTGQLLLVGYCTAVEAASAALLFPGELPPDQLLRMNAGLLALQWFLGSVCFFFSCLCSDTRGSVALGAGVPTLMYLVQMLANMGGKLEPLRYATVFTLYDPTALAAGQAAGWRGAGILLAGALVLNLAAGAVFCRKDLPL